MIDLREIRKDPLALEAKLRTKVEGISLSPIVELDARVRALKTEVEELKAKRNGASKEIGEKKRKGEAVEALMLDVGHLGDRIQTRDHEVAALERQMHELLGHLPNVPMDDVPVSPSPKDNVCVRTWGEKRVFDFPFKNHVELNEKLKLFDFGRAAKVSGSNWPLYRGMGARLEWALLNYMLDVQRKNGFLQIIPPLLVKPEVMFWAGQLPKFEGQFFKLGDDHFDLYLIPTSESVLNGLHADEILEEEQLPLKYTAYSPCFRREAGAAGSNERGLIRTHQFNKVEMFSLCAPETSDEIFEGMVASAQEVLEGLELHYRSMLLTTGDMSFAAARTIDIEVWLPGQNRYYEVSSVSNCTDFQARRAQIRFRRKGGKPELLHTLNGSGLATSRLMVALLENNQQRDGTVLVPKALQRYLQEEVVHIS